jgi:hypothetical protein
MAPFPLFLSEPLPGSQPGLADPQPCLTIILSTSPSQVRLFSHQLEKAGSPRTLATYECPTMKLVVQQDDQA